MTGIKGWRSRLGGCRRVCGLIGGQLGRTGLGQQRLLHTLEAHVLDPLRGARAVLAGVRYVPKGNSFILQPVARENAGNPFFFVTMHFGGMDKES